MKRWIKRLLCALFSVFILLMLSNNIYAVPQPSLSVSNKEVINRVVSIATYASTLGTAVNVLGNGKIPAYVTKTQDSPPRITVDIFCVAEPLETINFAVESSNLKGLRVGHHLDKIRMVLDVPNDDIPTFAIESVDNELTIFLNAKELTAPIENNPVETQSANIGKEIKVLEQPENTISGNDQQNTALAGNANQAAEKLGPAQLPALNAEDEGAEQARQPVAQINKRLETEGLEDISHKTKLTQIVPDDGRNDTAFLIESINSYEDRNWSGAVEKLTHLIKTYPSGRYSERAYFLLAKAYEQYYAKSVSEHFAEIKKYYENAIFKFPESAYVPEAYLGIGDLSFKTDNYYESLAYYNLVAKKAKNPVLTARALIQKTNVLFMVERKEETFSIAPVLEDVASRLPDVPEKVEAKISRAKILYEMKEFRESLNILSEQAKANSRHIYQYPEIFLYMGYDYYQLQDNKRSRENLLRFYNSNPDHKLNHLILTQIGDTLRNEGFVKKATKYYQLVLKLYPDMEGAVISKIRLAEQQEDRTLLVERGIVKPVNVLGDDPDKPKAIYEAIINKPIDKKDKNSLRQLALLKLAIIYQKEQEYKKSFEYLKKMFVEYPKPKLKKEGRRALIETIDGLFKQDIKEKRYNNIINFYLAEKELILMANAPELFITAARAFVHQDFEELGTAMFIKADILLSDEDKPPDLLYLLGQHFYNQAKFEVALKRFSLLTDNYPDDQRVPYAYRLKGEILMKQKKYQMAAEMFSGALKYPAKRCEKLRIFIYKATALAESNSNAKALEATKEADRLKSFCSISDHQIYQEVGDLYLRLGNIERAIKVFNLAVEIAVEKADKLALMLKIAEGYRVLNQKEDFLALYKKISDFNDPFWSNLAKERMEEIDFNWEMDKVEGAWKKREKS